MPSVNDVGEPCAGEPHARFDGRVEETHHAPEGLHQQEGDLPARQSMMARAAQTGAGSAASTLPNQPQESGRVGSGRSEGTRPTHRSPYPQSIGSRDASQQGGSFRLAYPHREQAGAAGT